MLKKNTPPIPEDTQALIPYLIAEDAPGLISFLETGLGATQRRCHFRPDGSIMHAQLLVQNCVVMVSQADENSKANQAMLYLYSDDTDALYKRAVAAGGTPICEPMDAFYGDRNGAIADPAGNQWWLGTQQELISESEMQTRIATLYTEQGG